MFERIVPKPQQMSDERLSFPAQVAHERSKLVSGSDLVVLVQFSELNPIFLAVDGHCQSSCHVKDSRFRNMADQRGETVPNLVQVGAKIH